MSDTQLVRKLVIVVLLKLLTLGGLWWAFVRESRVEVDAASVAASLQRPSETQQRDQEHGQ